MKNYLLLITCTLFCSIQSFAQTNLGFESWTNMGTYEDPTGWTSSNFLSVLGGTISVVKGPAHWGNTSLSLSPTTFFGSAVPGFAGQQVYYTKRPKSVSLYYKYNGGTGDSSYFSIDFSKGPTDDSTNPIGFVEISLPKAKNWTRVEADITWNSALSPDSLTLFVSTSENNPNDTLLIDDIGISMFGLAVHQADKPAFNIYLNSMNQLYLDAALVNDNSTIIIRNMLGQAVLTQTVSALAIDLQNLASGTYAYEIISDHNTPVTGKFIR